MPVDCERAGRPRSETVLVDTFYLGVASTSLFTPNTGYRENSELKSRSLKTVVKPDLATGDVI